MYLQKKSNVIFIMLSNILCETHSLHLNYMYTRYTHDTMTTSVAPML